MVCNTEEQQETLVATCTVCWERRVSLLCVLIELASVLATKPTCGVAAANVILPLLFKEWVFLVFGSHISYRFVCGLTHPTLSLTGCIGVSPSSPPGW